MQIKGTYTEQNPAPDFFNESMPSIPYFCKAMQITTLLVNWYNNNKRSLPWRETTDPYFIWLSEIIMQQTRINQGMGYYYKFTETFPNVAALAEADEFEVLKLWQGLGYYSRARNLHHTAQYIHTQLHDKFPDNYSGLLKLKGIGSYTAAAIASISYNEGVAVIDGNVARVLSRLFKIEHSPQSTSGSKQLKEVADEILDKNQPGTSNQALMELGALVCTPRNPDCGNCPLIGFCEAYQKNAVARYPQSDKKVEVKTVYFNYLVIHKNESIILRHRSGKGIWKNLYDFPCIESTSQLNPEEFKTELLKSDFFGSEIPQIKSISAEYTHKLTHRILRTVFYEFDSDINFESGNYIKTGISELKKYPIPRLIENYLQDKNLI